MKFKLFTHSLFGTPRAKQSITITLEEFVNRVREGYYRADAERYRTLLAEGNLQEAAALKQRQAALSVAGEFLGGHSRACQVSMNGVTAIDLDHTDERTEEFKQLLCRQPYVVACLVSLSGRGLKCFVRIDACTQEEYAQAYRSVAAGVDRLLGFACDKQCSDVSRLCFVSFDAQAYFNPLATPYPWRNTAEGVTEAAAPAPLKGYIPAFLEQARTYQQFAPGRRHNFMLSLGRSAARKGFSPSELNTLIAQACREMNLEDYTPEELRRDVTAGYQYVTKSEAGFTGSGSLYDPCPIAKSVDLEQDMYEKNQELRAATPCFSLELLEGLPDLLKRARSVAATRREADFLLMATLTHLGVCLPNVTFSYGYQEYGLNLFFAVVAPPATSKGIIELATRVSGAVDAYYLQQGEKAQQAYKVDRQNWEMERSVAHRARQTTLRPAPEPPVVTHVHLPASISKTLLVKCLAANGQQAAIIHTSEINTLVSAIGQDYGKQDDLLCAAAQNESYAYGSLAQGGIFTVPRVLLAFCLSGTPDQYVCLINSQDNGLYSRWVALTAPAMYEFRNQNPHLNDRSGKEVFSRLGQEVLQMHLTLRDMPPSVITFTDRQWRLHTEHFDEKLKHTALEGTTEASAIIKRGGMMTMRIASILTMLRKWNDRIFAAERECTDEDFRIAMHLVDVLDEHVLLLTSSLPRGGKRARPLQPFFNITPLIQGMPRTFGYNDFVHAVKQEGYSESTAKRALHKAVALGMIEKKEGKYVKKKRAKNNENGGE